MNIRQTIQKKINKNLQVRFFSEDINWYNVEVFTDWFLNIYNDVLLEESNGIRLSKVFNCVNEIISSLKLFTWSEDLYNFTEEVTLDILKEYMI